MRDSRHILRCRSPHSMDADRRSCTEQRVDWWHLCAATVSQGLVEESDEGLRQQLAALLRLHTTREALSSLDAYVQRMPPEQTSILYLAGALRALRRSSPSCRGPVRQCLCAGQVAACRSCSTPHCCKAASKRSFCCPGTRLTFCSSCAAIRGCPSTVQTPRLRLHSLGRTAPQLLQLKMAGTGTPPLRTRPQR